jgi:hypothetical protein
MENKFSGNDNAGVPKQLYLDKLKMCSESELLKETETIIWLSAYASNNPYSDYHWQKKACAIECNSRGSDLNLFETAYKRAVATM